MYTLLLRQRLVVVVIARAVSQLSYFSDPSHYDFKVCALLAASGAALQV